MQPVSWHSHGLQFQTFKLESFNRINKSRFTDHNHFHVIRTFRGNEKLLYTKIPALHPPYDESNAHCNHSQWILFNVKYPIFQTRKGLIDFKGLSVKGVAVPSLNTIHNVISMHLYRVQFFPFFFVSQLPEF